MNDAAETPLEDHFRRALEEMMRSPIMRLDSFPNDPSRMSSSFSGRIIKDFASYIIALERERKWLLDALKPFRDASALLEKSGKCDRYIFTAAELTEARAAYDTINPMKPKGAAE